MKTYTRTVHKIELSHIENSYKNKIIHSNNQTTKVEIVQTMITVNPSKHTVFVYTSLYGDKITINILLSSSIIARLYS
jgi:hypothetical protein